MAKDGAVDTLDLPRTLTVAAGGRSIGRIAGGSVLRCRGENATTRTGSTIDVFCRRERGRRENRIAPISELPFFFRGFAHEGEIFCFKQRAGGGGGGGGGGRGGYSWGGGGGGDREEPDRNPRET
jgi:hypothetical protein